MPYKPKGPKPMKGTGAIIINVLHSSITLMPPTFFKANMDENFFFLFGLLQREEFQHPNFKRISRCGIQ